MKRADLGRVLARVCAGIPLLFFLLLISGCAARLGSTPIAGREAQPRPTADRLAGLLAERASLLPSLRVQARLRYEGPQDHFRSSQMIVVATPDLLRIDVMNPFGISFTLASDGERLSAYNRGDGILYTGTASPHNIGRLSGLALEPRMLVATLRGLPPSLPTLNDGDIRAQEDAWLWSRNLVGGGTLRVAFDQSTLQVQSVSVEDYPGIGTVSALFSDYAGFSADDIARRVQISLGDGGQLELIYERSWKDVKPGLTTFQVEVPSEVERIDLDVHSKLD